MSPQLGLPNCMMRSKLNLSTYNSKIKSMHQSTIATRQMKPSLYRPYPLGWLNGTTHLLIYKALAGTLHTPSKLAPACFFFALSISSSAFRCLAP